MRILHTAESYAPTICGVQQVTQRISEGLVKCGHNVTVATTYDSQRDFRELNGVKVEQFDITGKSLRGFKGEVKKYQEFISNFKCDIMMNYAAQQWASDLVFPLLKKLSFRKVFIPCGYSTLDNWKWKPYFWLLPRALKQYDHIIYHSENYQDKEFGDKHSIKPYSVIGNGASDEEFLVPRYGFRSEYGINTSEMLLCVASYSRGKNQEIVLRAYQQANLTDTTLVFIGPEFNDYSNRLRALIAKENGSVRLLEKIPRQMVVAAYHEADLFIFGSLVECFPLVIVEAMASGTPFISTGVGSVPKLPGGVVVSTVEEMSDAIGHLAKKGPEWQELADVGRQAWEGNYRWENIVGQYEALYLKLISDGLLK